MAGANVYADFGNGASPSKSSRSSWQLAAGSEAWAGKYGRSGNYETDWEDGVCMALRDGRAAMQADWGVKCTTMPSKVISANQKIQTHPAAPSTLALRELTIKHKIYS
eukprot:5021872-Amphidinium_carterae.1